MVRHGVMFVDNWCNFFVFRRRKSPRRKRILVKREHHRAAQGRRRKRRNSRMFGNGKFIVLQFIVKIANSLCHGQSCF